MITNTYTIAAQAVRKGDRLLGFGIVADKAEKIAWVTFTNEEGATKRYRVEEEVTVERTEKTEEEKAAEVLVWQLRLAEKARTDAYSTHAEQAERIAKSASAATVSYSDLGNYLEAQATLKVWAAIDHMAGLEQHANLNLLQVVELFVTYSKERAAQRGGTNPLSRSTSQLSNLLDDLDAYAVERFCNGLGRWGW